MINIISIEKFKSWKITLNFFIFLEYWFNTEKFYINEIIIYAHL